MPQIGQKENKQEVFKILINDEIVKDLRGGDSETQKFLGELAEKIIGMKERNPGKIYDIIFATTHLKEAIIKKDFRFAILRDNISKSI